MSWLQTQRMTGSVEADTWEQAKAIWDQCGCDNAESEYCDDEPETLEILDETGNKVFDGGDVPEGDGHLDQPENRKE